MLVYRKPYFPYENYFLLKFFSFSLKNNSFLVYLVNRFDRECFQGFPLLPPSPRQMSEMHWDSLIPTKQGR